MEVVQIQDQASQLASKAGRSLISLPDLLLAIANNQDVGLCRKFIDAGIDLDRVNDEYSRPK